MIRVLITDVDGVLNCCGHGPEHYGLNKDKVKLIHRIINKTGCKVVLSSSWRKYPHMKARVEAEIPIWDSTPVLKMYYEHRGEEIKEWMDHHPEVEKCVILDDDPSAGDWPFKRLFVRTESHVGLTGILAQEIIDRLNS